MHELNKEVARNFLTAITAGDVEGVKRYVTRDLVIVATGTSIISGTHRYDDVVALAPMFKEITREGIAVKFLALTAEDDRVSVEMEGSAVMKDGTPYNNQYHFLLTIRDGKVCRVKEYFDTKLVDRCFAPYMTKKKD